MTTKRVLKSRLAAGEPLIGTMIVENHSPAIARMLATAGVDFAIIDMEHGSFTYESMQGVVLTARACGLSAIVRVPEVRRETILKPLDVGADALLVPQVNTPQEVTAIMGYAKYPPLGQRGTALGRGHCDYAAVEPRAYLADANRNTAVIIQIETAQAVERVDELLAMPGVDAAFVGPMDLSVDLGIAGDTAHPQIASAIDDVVAAGRRHGVPIGIQLFDQAALRPMLEKGVQFVSFGTDIQIIMSHMASAVSAFRTTAQP